MRASGPERASEPTRFSRPVIYSLLVHAVLVAALIFGVNWRNDEPQSIAVELWDALPASQNSTPPAPRLEPKPLPEKPREAKPKPEPPEPVSKTRKVPAEKPEPARDDAEIKRKAEAKREALKHEMEKKQREQDKKQREVEKKLESEREKKLLEKERQQKERDVENKRKLEEERTLKAARERNEAAALQKLRSAEEQRATEAARAGQQRASNQALIEEYKRKIRNKILAKVITPPDLSGNPEAVFDVVLLPGGDVLNAKLTKPSGNAAWDAAVERAIHGSQPLPLPADPELFSKFRELNLRFKPN